MSGHAGFEINKLSLQETDVESALVVPIELASIHDKTKGAIQLGLRPSFDLRDNEDGYVVSCFTPGLKQENLHAEVVMTDGAPVLIIRGGSMEEEEAKPAGESSANECGFTLTALSPPPSAGADTRKTILQEIREVKKKSSHELFRTQYRKFEQRMSLPTDVDQVRN